MKKQQSHKLLNWIGYGNTKKEAKENAMDKAERMLSGPWTPVLLEHCGHMAVIWRGSTGEVLLAFVDPGESLRGAGLSCGFKTMSEAELCARSSLAKRCADIDDPHVPSIIAHNHELSNEYRQWCAWQRAHRSAPDSLTTEQRHTWASSHQREFMAV